LASAAGFARLVSGLIVQAKPLVDFTHGGEQGEAWLSRQFLLTLSPRSAPGR
jgi:hypothetical protein